MYRFSEDSFSRCPSLSIGGVGFSPDEKFMDELEDRPGKEGCALATPALVTARVIVRMQEERIRVVFIRIECHALKQVSYFC